MQKRITSQNKGRMQNQKTGRPLKTHFHCKSCTRNQPRENYRYRNSACNECRASGRVRNRLSGAPWRGEAPMAMVAGARLWPKVDVQGPNECWDWKAGKTSAGYGILVIDPPSDDRRFEYAHRVAWMATFGPIPDGLYVCHTCDRPECVSPNHLFLGTAQDNMTDMVNKKRHCYGENSPNAKLTDAEVEFIRTFPPRHGIGTELARLFDVSSSLIYLIRAGKQRKLAR